MRRLAVLLAACNGDPVNTVCSGFVGDPSLAAEIELLTLSPEGQAVAVTEGGRVALIEAPQGGKHVFAGFRARNLDTCPISITGQLRDPATGQVRFEGRPVSFVDGDDGWAYPRQRDAISSYANIPVCPNGWSTMDIFDQPYELVLTARDRDGRTVTRTAVVTPSCAQPTLEANCRCTCAQGYDMDVPCPAPGDAGP
jgi:hypothetical protein